jgi:uncharacterized membrane protein YjjB (DUF3815 family)
MWPAMLISSVSGYITLTLLAGVRRDVMVVSLPTVAAAFVVGVVSNLYARVMRDIAVGPMLSGITCLVPGSLGVKGTLEFSVRNPQVGVDFVYEMLVVAASVTVGLLAASVVVFPMKKGRKRFYMAY